MLRMPLKKLTRCLIEYSFSTRGRFFDGPTLKSPVVARLDRPFETSPETVALEHGADRLSSHYQRRVYSGHPLEVKVHFGAGFLSAATWRSFSGAFLMPSDSCI